MACIVIYYCNNTIGNEIRIIFNNYFFLVVFLQESTENPCEY